MDSTLKIFIQSLTTANQALREAIEAKNDEADRMEHFEQLFRKVQNDFMKFEQMVTKYKSQAQELDERLQQEIARQLKYGDDLRRNIASLKRSVEQQDTENRRLEENLREDVERLNKLQSAE